MMCSIGFDCRHLERAPEWKALPATVSPEVRRLLERCLEKDPQQRLRDIGEAEIALDRDRRTPARRSPTLIVAASALLAAIAIVVLLYRLRAVPPPPAEPPVALTDFGDSAIAPAI